MVTHSVNQDRRFAIFDDCYLGTDSSGWEETGLNKHKKYQAVLFLSACLLRLNSFDMVFAQNMDAR